MYFFLLEKPPLPKTKQKHYDKPKDSDSGCPAAVGVENKNILILHLNSTRGELLKTLKDRKPEWGIWGFD